MNFTHFEIIFGIIRNHQIVSLNFWRILWPFRVWTKWWEWREWHVRVADAHRLWGATSSPTKFHLSSCHASSFCNNLASLALQLMEREPIIQHFGVWVEIQLEAQHPQLRYLAPSQIWGLRSLSLLLEGGWALGQCRQLYLHLLINSAILFRADKCSSESDSCSMVYCGSSQIRVCMFENTQHLLQVASCMLPHVFV